MGDEMNDDELAFVSFEKSSEGFKGSLSLQNLSSVSEFEKTITKAEEIYEQYIQTIKNTLAEIYRLRRHRLPGSARMAWELGDTIFRLTTDLKNLGLQIDGLYDHLLRDTGANKKWLEKVIILRRYVPERDLIPESLTWTYFEKSTRRKAENIFEPSHSRGGSL